MKVFLDSADVEEIEKGLHTGVVDGITSNQRYVALAGRPTRAW